MVTTMNELLKGKKKKKAPNLSKAQLERLALLTEELGEAQQCIGKILRHGYESSSPWDSSGDTNKEYLEKELGDVLFCIKLLAVDFKDLDAINIDKAQSRKDEYAWMFMHHNKKPKTKL